MKTVTRQILLGVITSCILSASPFAHATNGYFNLGYSAKDKGTAGAGIARGTDALSMATNPATMLQVGERMDFGLNLFVPTREYTVSGQPALPDGFSPVIGGIPSCNAPGQAPCQIPFSISQQTVESSRDYFVIPNFAMVREIDDTSAWGVSVYANGGMNTTYTGGSALVFDPQSNAIARREGTFGGGRAGVDLAQLFLNFSYAWKPSENLDLGVGVIGAVQRFRAQGLQAFANISLDPENLTDNGHDTSFGLGLKFGATYHVNETFSVAVSYQTETKMSEFDDYRGLFAEEGDFDLPATLIAGLSYDFSRNLTLLFDYQAIYYGGIPSVSNSINNLVDGSCVDALNNTLFSGAPSLASGNGCLGGSNGAGFGWDDMHVIKAGMEWRKGENTYRFGVSSTNQPIPESEVNFNILAPGVIEHHISAGLTTKINEREWTFFAMYMPSESVTGTSLFDPGQTISFEMHQFEFGAGFRF